MATGKAGGNLMIFSNTIKPGAQSTSDRKSTGGPSSLEFIDSDKEETEEKYLTQTYSGVKSAIIDHFCKDALIALRDISGKGNITKYPKTGEPVEKLEINYAKNKADEIDKLFRDLDKEVETFLKEEVDYDMGQGIKIDYFIKEHRQKDDILFYKDFSTRKVYVVGLDYDTVKTGLHQLKVLLGKLIPTKRMQRQISDPGKEQRSSSLKGSSYAPSSYEKKTYDDNTPVSSYGAKSYNASRSHRQSSGYDASEEFSFEADLNNGFKLKIYKASITRLEVDTIVNAANDCLMHGGGVARVIAVAAGHKLDQESREFTKRFGYLEVGKNCLTTAGNMTQYKSVIHAVGPQWHDYSDKVECMDALYETVWNVLDTCDTKGYFSVGMSSISAGIYGVPKELCADMYIKAAVDFSNKKTQFPKELHIIDVDTSILKLVQQSAEKWQENVCIDQKVTVPQFLKSHPELDVGGWNTSNKGGRKDFKDHSRSRDNNHGNSRDSHGNDNKGHGRYGQNRSNSPDKNKYGNHGNSDRGGHHNRDQGHSSNDKGHKGHSDSDHHNHHSGPAIASKSGYKDGKHCSVDLGPISKTSWSADEHCFYIDSGVLVKVYKGSIDKVRDVDAIVCANDNLLLSKGYIANSLKKAGGKDYEKAFKKMEKKHLPDIQTNDVFKCSGGNMRVKFVLHVVLERIQFASNKEMKLYREGIENVMKKANKNHLKKLAIPLVGTGEVQHDDKKLGLCCQAFVHAIHMFCSDTRDNDIAEIHLVNYSETVCKALVTVLNKTADKYGSSSKPERRGSSPADHISSGSVSTSSYTGGRGHESGATGHSGQSGTKFKDSYRGNSGSYSGTRNKDSFRDLSGSQRGNPGRSLTEEDMETDDPFYEEIGGDDPKPSPAQPQEDLLKNKKGNLNIIMD